MRVLGTGIVGRSIATRLVSLGHDVMMGSRTAENQGMPPSLFVSRVVR